MSVGNWNTALSLRIALLRWRIVYTMRLRRSWSMPPLRIWRCLWPSTHHLLLCPVLILLLLLKSSRTSLEQRTLDWLDGLGRKDGLCIQRSGHWFFPCFQHLIQFPAYLNADQAVGVHKSSIEVSTKDNCVRGSHVFYNRIEDVQCWEFSVWGRLRSYQ